MKHQESKQKENSKGKEKEPVQIWWGIHINHKFLQSSTDEFSKCVFMIHVFLSLNNKVRRHGKFCNLTSGLSWACLKCIGSKTGVPEVDVFSLRHVPHAVEHYRVNLCRLLWQNVIEWMAYYQDKFIHHRSWLEIWEHIAHIFCIWGVQNYGSQMDQCFGKM